MDDVLKSRNPLVLELTILSCIVSPVPIMTSCGSLSGKNTGATFSDWVIRIAMAASTSTRM